MAAHKYRTAIISERISNDGTAWDWGALSRNGAITWDVIRANPDLPWDWNTLSNRPGITLDIIRALPQRHLNWWALSCNPHLSMDIVQAYPDKPWNWEALSQHKNITWDVVRANPDKPWKWFYLSESLSLFNVDSDVEAYCVRYMAAFKIQRRWFACYYKPQYRHGGSNPEKAQAQQQEPQKQKHYDQMRRRRCLFAEHLSHGSGRGSEGTSEADGKATGKAIKNNEDNKTTDVELYVTTWHSNDQSDAGGDSGGGDDSEEEGGDQQQDRRAFVMRAFGVTMEGLSVMLRVDGFTPFFYVKAPKCVHTSRRRGPMLNELERQLMTLLPDAVVRRVRKRDFWGFTNGEQFDFFRLAFRTQGRMRHASAILRKRTFRLSGLPASTSPCCLELYESNVDPLLRFLHIANVPAAGWVRVRGAAGPQDGGGTTCDLSLACHWKAVVAATEGGSGGGGAIAPLLVASFDIECNSAHGDFPVAKKDYRRLAIDLEQAWDRGNLKNANEYTAKVALTQCMLDALSLPPLPPPAPAVAAHWRMSKLELKDSVSDSDSARNQLALEVRRVVDDVFSALRGPLSPPPAASEEPPPSALERLLVVLNNALGARWPLQGDAVIQIGTTLGIHGAESACCERYVYVLGSCEPFEGAVVRCFEREADLLLAWVQLIRSLDPDVLLGYNIYGFDMAYLYDRAVELLGTRDCSARFCRLGRIEGLESSYVERQMSSSALGDNVLRYLDMHGRVVIDLMKVVQRDHRLDSYKLDTVAEHFMGVRKHDVSPNDIFRLQRGTSADRRVIAQYCVQDCELCNRLADRLKILANNIGMANVCMVPLHYIFMRGQGVKIFSLVARRCRQDGLLVPTRYAPPERPMPPRTTDVVAAKPGTRTAGQPSLHEFYGRAGGNRSGSSTRCNNGNPGSKGNPGKKGCQGYRLLQEGHEDEDEDEDEGYEGAIVLEPEVGMYLEEPVSVLDYNSLYPSSMISHNISHDSLVLDAAYDGIRGVTYTEVAYDRYEGDGDARRSVGRRVCRYARANGAPPAVLPRILQDLLAQRKATRRRIDHVRVEGGLVGTLLPPATLLLDDASCSRVDLSPEQVASAAPAYTEFERAVLDGLQLAYKVTANSLYGQMGARTSPLYLKDIAACTTAVGRQMILQAKSYVEEVHGGRVVYGDTDSIFVVFKAPPPSSSSSGPPTPRDVLAASIASGKAVSRGIRPSLAPPHNLDYEKTFFPLLLLSKKRYVGLLYEDDPDATPKRKSMGIALKRRDYAPIVKDVYGGTIDIILHERDVPKAVGFLAARLRDLAEGRFQLQDLVISKTLRSYYKLPHQIAHNVLARRMFERDPGSAPQVNDRVPYVFVETRKANALMGDRIEHVDYVAANRQEVRVDTKLYIQNQILKPCVQLLAIAIEQVPGYRHNEQLSGRGPAMEALLQQKGGNNKKARERLDALREREVERLVFEPVLSLPVFRERDNRCRAQNEMTAYFKPSAAQ